MSRPLEQGDLILIRDSESSSYRDLTDIYYGRDFQNSSKIR